jgi:hypothetical protein
MQAERRGLSAYFKTGVGLQLMRLESDIALAIITRSRNEGWLTLPIHDSFLTAAVNEERLKLFMEEEYYNKLLVKISIKKSIMYWSDLLVRLLLKRYHN